MRRLTGQVIRGLWAVLHRVLALLLPLTVIVGVGAATLAWRLTRGPIELPWLAAHITQAANRQLAPDRIVIGSADLAWEGFRHGFASPLDIRLMDLSLIGPLGAREFAIPRAELTLSLAGLMAGHIEPATLALDRPRLTLERRADGSLGLRSAAPATSAAASDATAMLREMARPPASGQGKRAGLLSHLYLLKVHDAALTILDRQLGATWHVPNASLELVRGPHGGADVRTALDLTLGTQEAQLTASALLPPGGQDVDIAARLGAVRPAMLATAAPRLKPLAALDAPVTTEAEATLGPGLALLRMRLVLQVGSGIAHVAAGTVPIVSGSVVLAGTPHKIAIEALRLTLPGTHGLSPTTLQAGGTVQRTASGSLAGALTVDLDHVAFADLPLLWPAGIAADARSWVTQNITGGIARRGHFEFGWTSAADLSDITLTRATGTLEGEGLTLHWLRPVPPVVDGQAELDVVDPDTLDVKLLSGTEAPETPNGRTLAIEGIGMQITGLSQTEQYAAINARIAGTVPAAVALLKDKRLRLLSRHPLPIQDPTGQVTATLAVSLPLRDRVTIDQVAIDAKAQLTRVHLANVVAGSALNDGTFDLAANNKGLALRGGATLGGIAADLQAHMDFTAGPPTQVLQQIVVSGRPEAAQLAAVGLDAQGLITGPVASQAILTERRNGAGAVQVTADLTGATLTIGPLGWSKPAGVAATGTATVQLLHDHATAIETIGISGDGLVLRGEADLEQGRIAMLRVERAQLGRTLAQGVIAFPRSGPIVATLSGASLDLSGRFGTRRAVGGRPSHRPNRQSARGARWILDARFDRVILAGGHSLSQVSVHARSDDGIVQAMRLNGLSGPGAPVQASIEPGSVGRTLRVTAADAGDLLRALGLPGTVDGGHLTVSGIYQDGDPDRPLAGTMEIKNFRLHNAPAVGRLLQAVTLYGLVEVLRGPGLGFASLEMPFRLRDGVLQITGARAFSPSLGLTAEGSIDFDTDRVDLTGTIVPAYFFNSLLGRMPMIGRLFSPEKGGGVFAGSYKLRGPLGNPQVSVNPLTALTPGFLRRLFGSF